MPGLFPKSVYTQYTVIVFRAAVFPTSGTVWSWNNYSTSGGNSLHQNEKQIPWKWFGNIHSFGIKRREKSSIPINKRIGYWVPLWLWFVELTQFPLFSSAYFVNCDVDTTITSDASSSGTMEYSKFRERTSFLVLMWIITSRRWFTAFTGP